MTDKIPMNDTNDMTATEMPPPNGHGASNHAADEAPREDAAGTVIQGTASSKKRKRSHGHKKPTASNVQPEPQLTPPETMPSELPASTQPAAMPAEPIAATPSEAAPASNLRLRMKIWTDLRTAKRYLVPTAFMRDVVDGRPISDIMCAYAIGEDEVLYITLRANDWQALPFAYFHEEGSA